MVRIVSMEAENIMKLKAVYIEPHGDMVEITGENEQGKTSLMDSIWFALGGRSVHPKNPIRNGEQKALVKLDMGEFVVKRTFTRKEDGGFDTVVTVTAGEGFLRTKPQDFLNTIVGTLSFDPLSFTKMDDRQQLNVLRGFVSDFDFAGKEKQRKAAYDARTVVNKIAKDARTRAENIQVPDEDGTEEVDESALIKELDEAGAHNVSIAERQQKRQAAQERLVAFESSIADSRRQIEALQEQIKRIEQTIAGVEKQRNDLQGALAAAQPIPAPIDTTSIRERLDGARMKNDRIRRAAATAAEKQRLTEDAEKAEKKAEELTAEIDGIDVEKEKAIRSAKLPVEGIGFEEDYVTLNGVPFSQASKSVQIRTGIAIAAALNPKVRIARVLDGSLLDKRSWELLREFAAANDMQIWVETVSSTRPGAIIIEDGSIAGIVGEEIGDGAGAEA